MQNKQLAIIILALTAIPLAVLLGIAMRYAECERVTIFLTTPSQVVVQWLIAAILADGNNEK
jgi:hypothetical protein